MVTLKEIAQECNVSVTTVSNILNGKAKAGEKTKQRVLQAVKEMGYQPNYIAQGLRNSKTHTIGIIAEDIAQFTTPGMIESIMEHCEEKGYRTIVQNLRLYGRWKDKWYHNDEAYHSVFDPALQELVSVKVDGIIYLAGHARVIRSFPEDFKIPVVMTYAYTESEKIPSVAIDDEKSAYEVVKYLLDMGHRKIGVIGGFPDNIHTQKRLLGYQKALFDAQVLFAPELVRYGNFERSTGYKESGELIDAGVTAIFCMTDRMAGGVYDRIEEKGLKVGRDISVAGFDDQDIAAYFRPPLTTTKLPLQEIGLHAAKLLIDKIEDEENAEGAQGEVTEILVPCTMQKRKSVCNIS
ncbi:MAG: LacI family DNA-binding transcriptional regulator [Lachnospiraceae bacterium]|nr:LacI family DNA-binding transcriptional regulator [Lachnospiraceae bacterium]